MAIGLASLLLGRQVFSQPKGTAYLEAVKEARLANGETEKTHRSRRFAYLYG